VTVSAGEPLQKTETEINQIVEKSHGGKKTIHGPIERVGVETFCPASVGSCGIFSAG